MLIESYVRPIWIAEDSVSFIYLKLRSGCVDKTLQINIDKGYGPQVWAAKIPRDSHLVETVNPCYFHLY